MIDFEKFIAEGVYDKHIFKAFWLAGGPGSGKSWVAARTLEGSGMKVINTDAGLKRYAKQAGLDLAKMNTFTDKEMQAKDYFRAKSKRGTQTALKHAIDGRLGLILDSTARDISRIESEASKMKYIGYDTYMVFVNTSLEVALKRNQMRPRKVPDAIVISNHKQVQQNIGKLQNLFGTSNFIIVDNNKVAEDVNPKVYKAIRRMVTRKPTSYQAISWIKRELLKKKRG